MYRHLTRRSLLALAPGLLLVPALVPSAATVRARPAAASPVATPPAADLDAVLAAGVERGLPGVALLVERGGDIVYSGAAGVARIEDQTPLRATDRFQIYSLAKTFTATVVLQLVDEGVLSLDDTVARWLDDPAVGRIPNTDRITLR